MLRTIRRLLCGKKVRARSRRKWHALALQKLLRAFAINQLTGRRSIPECLYRCPCATRAFRCVVGGLIKRDVPTLTELLMNRAAPDIPLS